MRVEPLNSSEIQMFGHFNYSFRFCLVPHLDLEWPSVNPNLTGSEIRVVAETTEVNRLGTRFHGRIQDCLTFLETDIAVAIR